MFSVRIRTLVTKWGVCAVWMCVREERENVYGRACVCSFGHEALRHQRMLMKRPIEAWIVGRALRPPSSASAPLLPNTVLPPSSGLEGLSYFCGDLCVPARCRDAALSEKRCDHTWWENLLEPCVFFLQESICWLVKLKPNSSLITIKVIPAQPQKANCCVCTLRANCCRPTNPTIRQWRVCWCWCCKCKKIILATSLDCIAVTNLIWRTERSLKKKNCGCLC